MFCQLLVIVFANFRILRTTVTADYETSNRKDCALTLRYDFPSDIYVDKYELATISLSRKVCTKVCRELLQTNTVFVVIGNQIKFYFMIITIHVIILMTHNF